MSKIRKIKLANLPARSKAKAKSEKTSVRKKVLAARKRESFTKFKFVMAVLSGTMIVLAFILFFTLYAAAIFWGRLQNTRVFAEFPAAAVAQNSAIYQNDKAAYKIDETIKLSIVNNASESIFLAPCQCFNKFEKKVLNKWEEYSLNACSEENISFEFASIEKIIRKAEESISAGRLDEGRWRGVSIIYFGCKKPEIKSCERSQKIYTNEFDIFSK